MHHYSKSINNHEHLVFEGAIDKISFSTEVRRLVEILNTEIASPEHVVFRPNSNPAGFARLITKRRLTIAEAYIKLISLSRHASCSERLEALQVLMYQVLHARNLSMPINTARVQIALMKNAVKMRGNRRRQLELMSDFSRASYGQAGVIRQLLRELNLIEVPETGAPLSNLELAWDDHVHDSMTEGRKSPSHLVLDAFIKGISQIVVAYYDLEDRETCEEIFRAAQIIGVRVRVGVEFSVGYRGNRLHYLYLPPQNGDFNTLNQFCDDNRDALAPFWQGIRQNATQRQKIVSSLLDSFNASGLSAFNETAADLDILKLDPIPWQSVEELAPNGQINRIHLGIAICEAMRPVALKRKLYLKNQYRTLLEKTAQNASVRLELERCRTRYEAACADFDELSPIQCAKRYIPSQSQIDYDSAFSTEADILPRLASLGGNIIFTRPLERGFQRAVEVYFSNFETITDVEVFNLSDYMQRNNSEMVEIRRFASFFNLLRRGDFEQIRHDFDEWHLELPDAQTCAKITECLQNRPLGFRCASDAIGWASNIPGMGFVHASKLVEKTKIFFQKSKHIAVPTPVAQLLFEQNASSQQPCVYLLSNLETNEKTAGQGSSCSLFHLWRYVNVNLKCLLLAVLGFFPAFYCLGLEYALLWFVLTSCRNAIVDLISFSGFVPRAWQARSIDRENLCTSLFFTGFSVPIMTLAKNGFDLAWNFFALDHGFIYTFAKFWCIALANGLYLASHNTLRGFEKTAVRGNFFRSVLSWPLATVVSYVLTPLGVPDVVQAKICSEFVGGVIEGTTKHLKQNRLACKSLFEVLRQTLSSDRLVALIARIDILYFWACYPQGKSALVKFMQNKSSNILKTTKENSDLSPARRKIYQAFTTEGSLEELTYIILANYPEEDLRILTDFVGENHDPFRAWLNRVYDDRHSELELK